MTRPRPKRPTEKRSARRKAGVTCQALVVRTSVDEQGRCESCASRLELLLHRKRPRRDCR
jgi:hypothetical protein